MVTTLIIILTAALMIAGLIGCIIPILPGPFLVLGGALVYAWYTDFTVISWTVIGVLSVFALLSQLLDYLASMIGAKKFGAGKWGMIGALVGGVVGLFSAGVFGIILGPFIGAIIFEMIAGKDFRSSLKIGVGTLVGFLGGAVGKVIIAVTMIVIFLAQVI